MDTGIRPQIRMWADFYIAALKRGETISFRPRGNSMVPRIRSGQKVTVAPVMSHDVLKSKDIVLCTVGRAQYLHLITASVDDRYQIGNNRGRINGWIARENIHGKLIGLEP